MFIYFTTNKLSIFIYLFKPSLRSFILLNPSGVKCALELINNTISLNIREILSLLPCNL